MSEDIKPNEAQINAIEHDHLFPAIVTASAGSGKTTLLVQRIVRLLSDMELNISADSLAVMTFTRNATKSMREKLNMALSKKLDALANSDTVEERERYNYLKKQLFLLRQATISTIDAFCLRMIKENAEAFDLPLNFTIADGAKKAAMQSQAMKSAMQTLYGTEFTDDERNALFFSFSFEDDEALEKTILSAAEKLESFPDPEQWIKDAVDVYKDIPSVEKEFLPLISSFLKLHVSRVVEYTKKYKSEDICNKFETEINNDPPKTKKTLDSLIKEVIPCLKKYIEFDIKRISTLEHDYNVYATNPSISNLCVLIDDLEKNSENPPDKKSRSGKNYSYKIRFKDISNIISNSVDALLEIKVNENDEKTILTSMQKTLKSFFKLLKIFMNCYELEKKTSGCIDFSDCERELYNKLSKDNEFRKQLSKRFSCIIVDEFQDSNDIQAEIFRLLGDGRLFYVGDVKQSIYSFRGADPYIMANLCKDGSGFEILPLNINYRSRTSVINTVNAAFSGLMTTKYGGVDYSKGNELNLGCELPEPNHKELYDSEIHLLYDSKKSSDDESNNDMAMPTYVAKRIQELHDDKNFLISDGKDEEKNFKYRRAEYSDFIILLRTKDKIDCYRKALAELGISSTAPKGSNFFETDEVLLVCNYLKIIDNPLLNEEMLKVIMSPIYRFNAEETAQIKIGILGLDKAKLDNNELKEIANTYRKRSLYNCISDIMTGKKYKCRKTDIEVKRTISPKLARFWNDLKSFRYFLTSNSPDALIRKVYEDTELISIVAAFEDSAGRVENIRRLQKMASDFVSSSGGSLSDFLRFVDRARENGTKKVEEAARPEIAENAVRIMTFHGSKGLEAPVCVMAELQKGLNKNDFTGNSLISYEHFIAMKHTDIKRRQKTKSIAYQAESCFIRERLLGDELRLLYVAMTRAREKLVMVSALNKEYYEDFNKLAAAPDLHDDIYSESKPFMCVLKTLMTKNAYDEKFSLEDIGCKLNVININEKPNNADDVNDTQNANNTNGSDNTDDINDTDVKTITAKPDKSEGITKSDDEVIHLSELIKQKYSHITDTEQQAKFTTTELAHKRSAKPISLTKPIFARDSKVSGVEKGNAYHHCMQHIPLDCVSADTKNAVKAIENALDKLVEQKKITSDERKIVEPERIAKFFTNDLGRRMTAAYAKDPDNVKREQSFYAEVNGRDVRQDYDGVISIQGQIDMYFIENDDIVVVDYKSDTIENLTKEIDNYKFQVEIYMKILKKLTGMKIKEMYLYAFLADSELKIE